MKKNKFKKFWKKFWFIVWKDNSLKGWLVSILFLFIVIKLIFFPLLNLITGTALPMVIVESCSMYHEGNLFSEFDNWWEDNELKYISRNIEKSEFQEFPLKSGFNKGDILFVLGVQPEEIEVGDIIIFEANYKHPIIHRVVKIQEKNNQLIFSTLGDNNQGQLEEEKQIYSDQIIGKAVAKPAPYLGWVKLIFFEHQKPVSQRGFCSN
jgi:signal peptidase I